MTMRNRRGLRSKLYIQARNEKFKKRNTAVTKLANHIAGIHYHNDRENQLAKREGNKAHFKHTLKNDIALFTTLIVVVLCLVNSVVEYVKS